jgi:hypothetical protein
VGRRIAIAVSAARGLAESRLVATLGLARIAGDALEWTAVVRWQSRTSRIVIDLRGVALKRCTANSVHARALATRLVIANSGVIEVPTITAIGAAITTCTTKAVLAVIAEALGITSTCRSVHFVEFALILCIAVGVGVAVIVGRTACWA